MKTYRLFGLFSNIFLAMLFMALEAICQEGRQVTIQSGGGARTLKSRALREVHKTIDELEKANLERSQTFGEHLDRAKAAATEGEKLINVMPPDYDAVQRQLDAATAELGWIATNDKLRADYRAKSRAIGDSLMDYCELLSIAVGDQAVSAVTSKMKQAADLFERGEIAASLKELAEARKEFDKLVQAEVANILEQAAELSDGGDHAKALALLNNGLKLAPESVQLKERLAEVRKLTVTTLKVEATVNGEIVPAMVNVDGEWETMPYIHDVAKGTKVNLRIVFSRGALSYSASSAEYVCDWVGEKSFTIELAPVVGPQLRKGWTIAFDGKGSASQMTFGFVRAGTFKMGRVLGDQSGESRHDVELRNGYWLGVNEVTQAQWMTLMEKNPSFDQTSPDNPVENVSWDDAMLFCRKLTNRERLAGRLPEGYVYTLPTEAQWEYACRAGSEQAYAFGEDDLVLALYGNVTGAEDGFPKVAPTGKFRANAWGFHDMHGNVSEWCRDLYGTYPENKVVEPTGPVDAEPLRIHRGGSWNQPAAAACSYSRDFATPGFHDESIGFRVALSKAN